DVVRARPRDASGIRALDRGVPLRVRRVRQGALAAVSDLADPRRPARARAARGGGGWPPCGRTCADADLVSVPLLPARHPFRGGSVVAPAGPRPDAGGDCGAARAQPTETRTGSQRVARPSVPHSTSTPSIRTSPAAVSNLRGMAVRI